MAYCEIPPVSCYCYDDDDDDIDHVVVPLRCLMINYPWTLVYEQLYRDIDVFV